MISLKSQVSHFQNKNGLIFWHISPLCFSISRHKAASKELSDDAWWFEWRENYSGVDLQFVAWSAWRWLDGPPATGQQGGSLNAQVPRVPLNFSPLIMLLWSFSWSRRRHTDRASFSYWKMKPRVRRSGHLLYQVLLILLGASHTLDEPLYKNYLVTKTII